MLPTLQNVGNFWGRSWDRNGMFHNSRPSSPESVFPCGPMSLVGPPTSAWKPLWGLFPAPAPPSQPRDHQALLRVSEPFQPPPDPGFVASVCVPVKARRRWLHPGGSSKGDTNQSTRGAWHRAPSHAAFRARVDFHVSPLPVHLLLSLHELVFPAPLVISGPCDWVPAPS